MDVVQNEDVRKLAVLYMRVSGPGQEQGDGFPRQRLDGTRLAMLNGYRIIREYQEIESGTTAGEDRKQWSEMMKFILASKDQITIIIERLDRLARDLTVQEHIVADLQSRGIPLISVTEPDLCSTDPTRVLMRQMMGAIVQYDKSMTILKLRGARERMRAATGRCEGRKFFGHRPRERKILERIQRMREQGHSYVKIADALNQEGIRPRTASKTWHPGTVHKILRRQGGSSDKAVTQG